MQLPVNTFKHAILSGKHQLGFWVTLPGGTIAELLAGSGYDWLLFDTEHAPTDVLDVLEQMQAAAPYPVSAVIRPANNDAVLIKRLLDLGAQTLLIPYVQSRAEAEAAVSAMRYAPAGMRGVSGLTRATKYGRVADYARTAASELCLLVQVETALALDRLEDIATVDGVDGIFIGPADLAASMGHPGNSDHPDVVAAIADAIKRIRALGKPAGILTANPSYAQACIDQGTTFTAVGIDMHLLVTGADSLRKQFP